MNCSSTQKALCGQEECSICYERSFAIHERALMWSIENELQPHQVLKNSNKKYKFNCEDCGHKLEMILKNVYSGQWCKYCKSDGLCEEDCLFCYQKSFASHPMAESWSARNDILPRQILRRSDKKCWFDCKDCQHSFQSALYSVNNDKHCPFCKSQQLCDKEDCNICFEKSCASHEMNNAWSPENEIQPRHIFLKSNKKIKFNCLNCFHTYDNTPNHYYQRGGSCPYCANKYLCEKDNCNSCFQKSFASHPHIHCWSNKNTILPRQLFKGSEIMCVFDCDICHSEFQSRAYNVLTGYWCPYCKKKTEAIILAFLKDKFTNYKAQMRFDWCTFSQTNNIMPFDFVLTDDKILIELDGKQHFSQVSNWDAPEHVQNKDIEKIKYCIQQGYSIIHLCQEDVWKNIYDWKKVLQQEVERLKISTSQCVFIQINNIYHRHITQLESNIIYTIVNPNQ
jgi:very-short-patch-repair endonuclease|uniref:Treble clef zinc finger domain-containing protein n=1 Tax=viral metagenome TaxID=1070528 RepID=A0A6C0BF54_9ZZZZ